jgi:hypothetical protein
LRKRAEIETLLGALFRQSGRFPIIEEEFPKSNAVFIDDLAAPEAFSVTSGL